jgi:hypothetical protein
MFKQFIGKFYLQKAYLKRATHVIIGEKIR